MFTKFLIKFGVFTLVTIVTISLTGNFESMASSSDDRYRSDSSSVFAPGYLNAAKQRAETIASQKTQEQGKGLLRGLVDIVLGKTENAVEKQAAEAAKVAPKLQQKMSSANKAAKNQEASKASNIINASSQSINNINIGSGSDQYYEGGRLISEVFDGKKYIYAGFDNVGTSTFEDAVAKAADGDSIILRGGRTYNYSVPDEEDGVIYGYYDMPSSIDFNNMDISVYGAFNEDGSRDLTQKSALDYATLSNVGGSCEIDGLTFHQVYLENSSGLTIRNCDITNGLEAVYSDVRIENNNITGPSGYAVFLISSTLTAVGNTIEGTATPSHPVDAFGMPLLGVFASTVQGRDSTLYLSDNNITSLHDQVFDLSGSQISYEIPGSNAAQNTQSTNELMITTNTNFTYQGLDNTGIGPYTFYENKTLMPTTGEALKTLLKNQEGPMAGPPAEGMGKTLTVKLTQDMTSIGALSAMPGIAPEETRVVTALAAILRNPSEDQKTVLDAIKALLADTEKMQGEKGSQSPELKKATDDLLQAVANILLAQGVPDLLKKGDVESVKGIFSELDQAKAKIMLEYTKGTKPYYENMIKDLAKNMAMLQGKNLLNPNMTKEELDKLPPSELDKILEKIKSMKDKTFEDEYLLQQEAKYRKSYLDPSKQKLETDLKGIMKDFTGRLNTVLENTKK